MGWQYRAEPLEEPAGAERLPERYKNPVFTVGIPLPSKIEQQDLRIGIVNEDKSIGVSWKSPQEVQRDLATDVDLSVKSLELPETIEYGQTFQVNMRVTNKYSSLVCSDLISEKGETITRARSRLMLLVVRTPFGTVNRDIPDTNAGIRNG